MVTLGAPLASGRDADVYEYGDGLVLRRYRDGRSAHQEAVTLRSVGALGYPVPTVYSCAGADIVMSRIEGPTLGDALLAGESAPDSARVLADLHERLHALPWPTSRGQALLHLDLHPLNVLLSGSGPIVIDWSNARPGPAGLDVAMTLLILAQVTRSTPDLREVLLEYMREFATETTASYAEYLAEAAGLRVRDPHQTAQELSQLSEAVDLAASFASG